MKKGNEKEVAESSPEDVANTQSVESKGKVPMNKEQKQKFEPWGKFETETLQLSADEERGKRDKLFLLLDKLEKGIVFIDEDIYTGIDVARMELRAARIKLDSFQLDQKHAITKRRDQTQIITYKKELERHDKNIIAFEFQLKQGRPIIGGGTVEAEPETTEEGNKQTK